MALPSGFRVKQGLHAVESSYVSASSLSALRAAIVRSVWSCKMPLANTPVVPGGCRPGFSYYLDQVPYDA